jgi:hypothetical protein
MFRVKVLDAQTGDMIHGRKRARILPKTADEASSDVILAGSVNEGPGLYTSQNPLTLALSEKPPKDVSAVKIIVWAVGYEPEIIDSLPLTNKRQDIVIKLKRRSYGHLQ